MEEQSGKAIHISRENDKTSMGSKVSAFFLGIRIADKILIGFIAGATMPILLGIYFLSTLNDLNSSSRHIIEHNKPLIKITGDLTEAFLAQEHYGARYIVLKKDEVLSLFWLRSAEFEDLVKRAESLPGDRNPYLEQIATLHASHNDLFVRKNAHLADPSLPENDDLDKEISLIQEALLLQIRSMSDQALMSHDQKMLSISNVVKNAYSVTLTLCALGIFIGFGAAILIIRNISGSIDKLKLATRKIAEGDFEHVPHIRQRDELWELATAFKYMGARLRQLEEIHLDASPLTKLPGGAAIENILEKRLGENIPTTFCLLDMDNFKAYNDNYGYARGSELIKEAARVIEESVDQSGSLSDFVGHIGGDDFAIITTPKNSRRICMAVIKKFDKAVPGFYSPEDRKRGYIAGETRQGEKMEFPLVSISIAAVSSKKGEIRNHIEIGELAAELKEAAKKIPGSSYVEDRRQHS